MQIYRQKQKEFIYLLAKKIKQTGQLEYSDNSKKKTKIPTLKENGQVANTDKEKAQLFGSTLAKNFSDEASPSFDMNNRPKIESYLRNNETKLFNTKSNDVLFDKEFTMNELENGVNK